MKNDDNRTSRKNKASTVVTGTLERRLRSYALAAGATLFVASPTAAEVVFTPNDTTLALGTYYIDLNHDGVNDFALKMNLSVSTRFSAIDLRAYGAQMSNSVALTGDSNILAAALKIGDAVKISHGFGAKGWMASGSNVVSDGAFLNTRNRSLGVKFLINGQVHYGWIGFRKVSFAPVSMTAILSGYAYETQPNKPIRVGDTGTTSTRVEAVDPFEMSSLELLAAGESGLKEIRRRNREAIRAATWSNQF